MHHARQAAALRDGCPYCGDPFPCLKHGKSAVTTESKDLSLMRSTRSRVVMSAAAAVAALGLLAGCGSKFSEPFKDAPRSDTDNGSPADLIRMPDGFSNAATKCDHGNRIYTAYHGDSAYASIAVVPDDPTCAGVGE